MTQVDRIFFFRAACVSNNPFPAKGFPIDELNRLALDRVKSIGALSARSFGS